MSNVELFVPKEMECHPGIPANPLSARSNARRAERRRVCARLQLWNRPASSHVEDADKASGYIGKLSPRSDSCNSSYFFDSPSS